MQRKNKITAEKELVRIHHLNLTLHIVPYNLLKVKKA